jgi:hypothetical protein
MHYFAFGHSSTHSEVAERKFFCLSPCWNFQAPRHAKCKLFCVQPPTFNAKGWRPNTTKFASAPNWASKLQVWKLQDMLNVDFFVFDLQLSIGRVQKKCLVPFTSFRTWSLEAPTHAESSTFFLKSTSFEAPKIGVQRPQERPKQIILPRPSFYAT